MPSRPEAARGPGRPPSGARERVLDAGLEVLKSDGYAGLTTAKVAARSGQNKALIGYHFGSKLGLVAAVAREVSAFITAEVLKGVEHTDTAEGVIRDVLAGIWRVMDEDERLARVYFELAGVSVVEPEVRKVMGEMRASWRSTLGDLLAATGASRAAAEAGSVYAIAALDGLALERLERGETPALARARELFVRSAAGALG